MVSSPEAQETLQGVQVASGHLAWADQKLPGASGCCVLPHPDLTWIPPLPSKAVFAGPKTEHFRGQRGFHLLLEIKGQCLCCDIALIHVMLDSLCRSAVISLSPATGLGP